MSFRQAYYDEPVLFDKAWDAEEPVDLADLLPPSLRRPTLAIPNLPEHEVVRHYTRLSQMTFGIDTGFY
ncbi:MAG: aminomethyl-transferring glycine dehydrogenase subunit GcvPB, partial [Thermoplasmata archaeon]